MSEAQLQLLVGMGRDRIAGVPLGRAYPVYSSTVERVADRVAQLVPALGGGGAGGRVVAQIEAEEAARGSRRAVAGFDFTFSVPKSASVLWAVADAGTHALIAQAHREAVAAVVAFMEREVVATRTGATAGDGAVAQVDVTGLNATAFDHFDSRAGDPHLHTHVVISNKAQTVLDGKWRSLDGRPMHAAVVALSELHEAVFADHMTRTFGVSWEPREMGRDRNPSWAITDVPEQLVAEFSTRARQINEATDALIADYVTQHGRRPSPATIMKLRAQATLATRPEKQVRSLAELTAEWRTRASQQLGMDATVWARSVTGGGRQMLLRADDVPLDLIGQVGRSVVEVVGEKRSTWRRWNLMAEAARQTMGWRFATVEDREVITAMVADAAEDRLLQRARTTTGPSIDLATVETITSKPDAEGRVLGLDQAAALASVAVSGRVVDVLVGPAGTGKTTAMNALRRAWEAEHGAGSVVGLAPSAVAAQVLADDLGIATENTAKWWTTHQHTGATFQAGQLVIIDEASLAGTLSLDRITQAAEEAGAKALLVGDYAQLQSVDAGGAFSLLIHDRDDAPELVDVHRFTHAWEKTASLELRHGRTPVIDTYLAHDRIHDAEAMTDAAYTAWRHDRQAGLASVLIAETRENVTALNVRARADLILEGTLKPGPEITLSDGLAAGVGSRSSPAAMTGGCGTGTAGSATAKPGPSPSCVTMGRSRSAHPGPGSATASFYPPTTWAEHVDLGYAVTAHRAQGLTTDTAHVLVEPTTTRENLYVAMTRGREPNQAYVILDRPDDHATAHPGDSPDATARTVLYGVPQHSGAELSAHETITAEQDRWDSIAQLAAEYETIAAAAQHDRWAALIATSGLTTDQAQAVIDFDAFGALTAELRRAEANHHHVDTLLPRLIQARGFADADDILSVIHHRLARATARPAGSGRTRQAPRLIAGLIPEATGPMTPDMQRALTERRHLIETRAKAVLDTALHTHEPWVTALGPLPAGERERQQWRRRAVVVAAYRDRRQITDSAPLGAQPEGTAQRIDRARAETALRTLTRPTFHDEPRRSANQATRHLDL